jgi:5-methyltetrahydrofolate--homocysteine methyltransferase
MTNLIQQGLALRELLRERILILDGAMGTMLQQANLTAEDFGGPDLEGCNENLVMTRPDEFIRQHASGTGGIRIG